MRFFVLHPLAILVAMMINCLPSSLPIMYAIILLLGVLLARKTYFRSMLIFPLSLGLRLFLIVLICLIFCYIVLTRVDVSVLSGAFLSLAGILLFLFVLLVLSVSVLNEISPDLGGGRRAPSHRFHQQRVSHQTPQFLKPCNSIANPFLKSQIRHWAQGLPPAKSGPE